MDLEGHTAIRLTDVNISVERATVIGKLGQRGTHNPLYPSVGDTVLCLNCHGCLSPKTGGEL